MQPSLSRLRHEPQPSYDYRGKDDARPRVAACKSLLLAVQYCAASSYKLEVRRAHPRPSLINWSSDGSKIRHKKFRQSINQSNCFRRNAINHKLQHNSLINVGLGWTVGSWFFLYCSYSLFRIRNESNGFSRIAIKWDCSRERER